MSQTDIAIGSLCAWRENRGGGEPGMHSVLNVLVNRAVARGTSIEQESLRPWQFSSMTAKGDPQLRLGPDCLDAADLSAYLTAVRLAAEADAGNLPDITGGATSYFASSMADPPEWAASMQFTVEIAGQRFYR